MRDKSNSSNAHQKLRISRSLVLELYVDRKMTSDIRFGDSFSSSRTANRVSATADQIFSGPAPLIFSYIMRQGSVVCGLALAVRQVEKDWLIAYRGDMSGPNEFRMFTRITFARRI